MALRSDLLSEIYDFPKYTNEVKLEYGIIANTRCRGTLLSLNLWRTGCLGAPWEYDFSGSRFNPIGLGVDNKTLVECRTSSNGVFGRKYTTSFPDTLSHVIMITRNNHVARAVSDVLAYKRSQYWSTDIDQNIVPDYDERSITNEIVSGINNEKVWNNILGTMPGCKVLRLDYADIIKPKIVDEVAKFLNVKIPARKKQIQLPEISSQYAEINAKWEQQYRKSNPDIR